MEITLNQDATEGGITHFTGRMTLTELHDLTVGKEVVLAVFLGGGMRVFVAKPPHLDTENKIPTIGG